MLYCTTLMNFKELKELIDIVASNSAIDEFEVERAGVRLRIRRAGVHSRTTQSTAAIRSEASPEVTNGTPAEPQLEVQSSAETGDFFYQSSPMVGTFYRAPSPDADPFVRVGDFVEKGSVLCIIEAMKLMNEIESEVAGEVVSIAVENNQPVEFGQRLFAIRPR
jgi:oxaloacetate decarboxylase alpha subunit